MHAREVTDELLALLRSMELFRGKSAEDLTEWLTSGKEPSAQLRSFAAGERILQQGSFGNIFFVIVHGSAEVTLDGIPRALATLHHGEFFGEMTLISGLPRNANVTALEACTCLEIPRRLFEAYMKAPGPFRTVMDRVYLDRGLSNHLRGIPAFAELDPALLDALAKHARLRIFTKDEVIVRQGDPADSMFLIRDGYVRVVKSMAGGEERIVAYLKDGSYFGESGLLHEERRNASVLAMGKVELIQISKADFLSLLHQSTGVHGTFTQRDRQLRTTGDSSAPGFVGELLDQGVLKATSALVIHLDACTRCGNCVKACAELHDGISRLTRRGTVVQFPAPRQPSLMESLLITSSCMHCKDPECMIGCPTGAISRDVNGEIVIHDTCIGCGSCARRCPYGNISMAEVGSAQLQRTDAPRIGGYLSFWRTPEDEPMMHEITNVQQTAVVRRLAVKCDLCRDYNYNHGCVHNCPYDAIRRIEPGAFIESLRGQW